jgi:hypothetical protein
MTTLHFPRRSRPHPPAPLKVPQGVEANVVLRLQPRETAVSDEVISAYGLGDDAEHQGAHGVTPLPLRLCVLLIFLGAVAFYGVGYAVFAAFRHLLNVLQ